MNCWLRLKKHDFGPWVRYPEYDYIHPAIVATCKSCGKLTAKLIQRHTNE